MGRRGGTMSDELKYELAKELGFYDTVQREGWGAITTRDAGNLVKRAIEIAEQSLAERGTLDEGR
ncbi:small, acid-soluble spore protein, alpha/beta type [Alicyclobacillus cycloheptanicus]|uniref:Small acid-soluble spore protein F (Minor alpha/beta-type SASP) n=1 Tax=Alicyclobacillus cycloheptanicus TaxID=1457 RepID=A0ABT9XIN2_9BACL|nr:small, acid-soluble spore protein, alpha/beta type [Alicyclobacillus cycloheptanicus]MDQ0190169.1 small acid-soluble spore protein F (minor alpha/beta-type SASP) [Alicyclobacillus cycloheptanicus]WDM02577.1 small, acid-soluble spore protein, alpha/beta type [Alicyclobacillus cycloheptanicus]